MAGDLIRLFSTALLESIRPAGLLAENTLLAIYLILFSLLFGSFFGLVVSTVEPGFEWWMPLVTFLPLVGGIALLTNFPDREKFAAYALAAAGGIVALRSLLLLVDRHMTLMNPLSATMFLILLWTPALWLAYKIQRRDGRK